MLDQSIPAEDVARAMEGYAQAAEEDVQRRALAINQMANQIVDEHVVPLAVEEETHAVHTTLNILAHKETHEEVAPCRCDRRDG